MHWSECDNCEVSLAYMPKSWTYDKIMKNMWDVGEEVNKVTISFLRQLLGVHKKTSNLAVLGETGKYPLSVKIFIHILKYWFRLKNSENSLLRASKEANMMQDHEGSQNWYKMVSFLLQATELQNTPVENDKIASKVINIFKKRIQNMYRNWWQDKLSSVEKQKTLPMKP